MSFIPAFDELKSPSPDQTTMTQYLPRRSTGKIGEDPPPAHNHDDNDCDSIPIPPPSKPSPSNPSHSTTHKKQPNYHKKKNRIHVGAYVYSRLGELHKAHPQQKRRVRAKKFGIVMESVRANQWLVNFDDNKTLTLKSSQLKICESNKPDDIHEPINEDESQLEKSSTSSFSFSPSLKKKSTHQTKRMLGSDFENEKGDNSNNVTPSTVATMSTTSSSATTTSIATATATATTSTTTTLDWAPSSGMRLYSQLF